MHERATPTSSDSNWVIVVYMYMLLQVHAMLNFLDASHYKLSHTLNSLSDQQSPEYKFSVYMDSTHDKMVSYCNPINGRHIQSAVFGENEPVS